MERVHVYIDGKIIAVNDEQLNINFVVPDAYPENFFYLLWWQRDNKYAYYTIENGDTSKQTEYTLEPTEENYNIYAKPFVDQWQAEKDRIEQEEAKAEAEYNSFENRQARALAQLKQDFEIAAQKAHIKSSLGFEADANSTANENVNGLLVTIGSGTVDFCDYYNQFHKLNKAQLETLQSEIIQNGQSLYAQKWQYRTAIENCTNNEQLDAVVETIEFTYMEFS